MPHWLIKSAIHRVISWTPNRQFWNGIFQTYVTGSNQLTRPSFESKVRECARFLESFSQSHDPKPYFRAFDLGTGWFPIIPIGFYLCGAKEVWTMDIESLVRPAALRRVLEEYCTLAKEGELKKLLPGFQEERIRQLEGLVSRVSNEPPEVVLERIGIHMLLGDAGKTPIPDGVVDFFESSGVLEYIPLPMLKGIFQEAKRIGAPGAIMCHRLNLIDQFSYFDKSITAFNFLSFNEKQWEKYSSPLIWQNRLPVSEYRRLLPEAGFEILREENTPGSEQDLAKVKLAPEFERYRREDLLILHSWITARKTKT